jgi:hypothetical protein
VLSAGGLAGATEHVASFETSGHYRKGLKAFTGDFAEQIKRDFPPDISRNQYEKESPVAGAFRGCL